MSSIFDVRTTLSCASIGASFGCCEFSHTWGKKKKKKIKGGWMKN